MTSEKKLGTETAIAVQEASKAVTAITNAVTELGAFLGMVFGSALKDVGDIAHQYTTLWRIKNLLTVRDKLRSIAAKHNITDFSAIPLEIGLPLLEAASCEGDEYLQNTWAELLASSMTAPSPCGAIRAYTAILSQLERLDVELLIVAYGAYVRGEIDHKPQSMVKLHDSPAVFLATRSFNNIERLGLIRIHKATTAPLQQGRVRLHFQETPEKRFLPYTVELEFTVFGFYFMRAVTDFGFKGNTKGDECVPVDDRFHCQKLHEPTQIGTTSEPRQQKESHAPNQPDEGAR